MKFGELLASGWLQIGELASHGGHQIGELAGQDWLQIGELGLAFVLSALIGSSAKFARKARAREPIRSSDSRWRSSCSFRNTALETF